jgi:hypothetical protein
MRQSKLNRKKSSRERRNRFASPLLVALGGLVMLVLAAIVFTNSKPASPTAPFTPQVRGAPRLEVDTDLIDFGKVKMDVPVQASFKLTNTGDQPLRFSGPPYIKVLEGC